MQLNEKEQILVVRKDAISAVAAAPTPCWRVLVEEPSRQTTASVLPRSCRRGASSLRPNQVGEEITQHA